MASFVEDRSEVGRGGRAVGWLVAAVELSRRGQQRGARRLRAAPARGAPWAQSPARELPDRGDLQEVATAGGTTGVPLGRTRAARPFPVPRAAWTRCLARRAAPDRRGALSPI